MKTVHIPDKLQAIFTDTLWSAAGLVLMNVIAQFVVYPCWNRRLGSEAYGNIVYLMGIMNIMAISVGSGINYVRMRQSAEGETLNRPYLLAMSVGTLLSLLILLLLDGLGALRLSGLEFALFCLLTAATMWRYYADVEYRLRLNYRGFFLYYLVIGLGYLVGMLLFTATGLWPLALLPGEAAGLALVLWRGKVLRADAPGGSTDYSRLLRLSLLLVGSNVLSHLIFNGDRIVLRAFSGAVAVSIYYIASLFGKTMTLITTPLNGVLVGYLAKYEGKLTRKLMRMVTGIAAAAVVLATAACVAASYIVLPFLYPAEFEAVKQYLLIASAAQVIYFTGNVMLASVLLRFTSSANQLIVNVVHGVLFAVICIPLAQVRGMDGFCWGLLGVNTTRYIVCIVLGFMGIERRIAV